MTEDTSDTVTVRPILACTFVAKLVSSEAVIVSVNSEGELADVVLKGTMTSNVASHV